VSVSHSNQRERLSSGNRVVIEISSTIDMLKLVDHVSEEFAQLAGFDEDSVHCLAVAVREAVVNGIKHGNTGDERKQVRVEYTRSDSPYPCVVVRVRDEGHGFDVNEVADPLAPENLSATGGRGVFLMRSFMDDVHVQRTAGSGTEIVMIKSLNQAETPS